MYKSLKRRFTLIDNVKIEHGIAIVYNSPVKEPIVIPRSTLIRLFNALYYGNSPRN